MKGFSGLAALTPDRGWSGPNVCLVLFLLTLFGSAYFFPRWADWNQNSRLDLVLSIVDDRTVVIDKYVDNTGDYALVDGRHYSDKAPGMAFLGVPIYAALRAALPPSAVEHLAPLQNLSAALGDTVRKEGAGLGTDRVYFFLALVAVTFATVAVPAALLAVLFYLVAGQFGLSERQRWAATALYAFGTIAFPYANAFVGHQTSAFLLFAAFAILFAVRRGALQRSWLLVAGLFLGYSAITEYQTALVVGILGVYALATIERPLDVMARLAAGALSALALLVIYDYVSFGTPLPIGYFHSALWEDVHSSGLVSLTYPHLDALWGITFGVHRGLFFLSPYLLFALVGYIVLWRSPERRPEFWVLFLAPLAFLVFNSSSAMWQGGFAVGPRYLVPSLPFLALAAGIGVCSVWQRRRLRPVVALACAWSVFAVWTETIAGQSFPDYTANPLFDLSLPRLLSGDIARNFGMVLGLRGWSSLLPLIVVALIGVFVWLRLGRGSVAPSGQAGVEGADAQASDRVRWASQ